MDGKLNMPIEVSLTNSDQLDDSAKDQYSIFKKRMELIRLVCADPIAAKKPMIEWDHKFDDRVFVDNYRQPIKYDLTKVENAYPLVPEKDYVKRTVDMFVPSEFQTVLGYDGDIHYTIQSILNARELVFLSTFVMDRTFTWPVKFYNKNLRTELREGFRSFLEAMNQVYLYACSHRELSDFLCIISYNRVANAYDERIIDMHDNIKYRINQMHSMYGLHLVTMDPIIVNITDTNPQYKPLVIIRVNRNRFGKWNLYYVNSDKLNKGREFYSCNQCCSTPV